MQTRLLGTFICLILATSIFAKEISDKTTKYKATIWAFPIGKVEGTINIKLFGENKGKLKIELQNTTEKNGLSISKSVETVEILTGAVKLIMIDSVYYKFISFRTDLKTLTSNYCVAIKDEKSNQYQLLANDTTHYLLESLVVEDNGTQTKLNNCCFKKVYGKDSFAIYQFGLTWNDDYAVVALPKTALYGKFWLINNSYFTKQEVWKIIQFRSCAILKNNINENKEGWTFDNQTPQAAKIDIWKKYIDTWENCQTTTN